ncbi:TIGR02646 family protein [Rheinheimera pacifica]|uniref:TIGR02646 family protein n=1 Tax=Rheinheimera pacifica TaxID=173990 RepID=A0A1H6N4H2_9GAMM|nr:retron Ec78 anti-phage system effector HNH endonuclease PtuB [Rheinheimera pacifica]SEI09515.1 TIGR02646 family protein [Rheinheimera pacifica]
MIKINKSLPPNPLTIFSGINPNADWNCFRNWNGGKDYKEVQNIVFSDQNQLCAYCEVNTGITPLNKRIEHFVSKSLNIRHHTDWFNIFGVCIGGSDHDNSELRGYRLPENLSCDAHKARLETKYRHLNRDWSGVIINPLHLPHEHNFFSFDKSSGELFANVQYCESNNIEHNKHDSTLNLVRKTLEVLNLNCSRLCAARREIFFGFERQVKQARKTNDIERLAKFAVFWSSYPSKEFQTTRNIILRENIAIQKLISE